MEKRTATLIDELNEKLGEGHQSITQNLLSLHNWIEADLRVSRETINRDVKGIVLATLRNIMLTAVDLPHTSDRDLNVLAGIIETTVDMTDMVIDSTE